MAEVSIKPIPFLVTGTAKVGTHDLHKWMLDGGSKVTHERIFAHHGRGQAQRNRAKYEDSEIEISWMASPLIHVSPIIRQSCIVHLMRNPWATLESLVEHSTLFTGKDKMGERNCAAMFIEKHWPDVFHHAKPYDQAAAYILAWHEILANAYATRTVITHRIEDSPNILFERMRDVQDGKKWKAQFPDIAISRLNTWVLRNHPFEPRADRYNLDPELLFGIMQLCKRWGYDL